MRCQPARAFLIGLSKQPLAMTAKNRDATDPARGDGAEMARGIHQVVPIIETLECG